MLDPVDVETNYHADREEGDPEVAEMQATFNPANAQGSFQTTSSPAVGQNMGELMVSLSQPKLRGQAQFTEDAPWSDIADVGRTN